MYNACKIVFCLFAFFNNISFLVIIFYMFIIALLYFFSSNFRELIDELQAKVQLLYNKFHGHYLITNFFSSVISTYNPKNVSISFVVCFVS